MPLSVASVCPSSILRPRRTNPLIWTRVWTGSHLGKIRGPAFPSLGALGLPPFSLCAPPLPFPTFPTRLEKQECVCASCVSQAPAQP